MALSWAQGTALMCPAEAAFAYWEAEDEKGLFFWVDGLWEPAGKVIPPGVRFCEVGDRWMECMHTAINPTENPSLYK